jgi:putative ABC transport system permease protein
MDAFRQDFRYAFRRLRSHPAFTTIVVLTLALGIGANTAIFSVVNTVLLRPLPYRAPEQLVTIYHYYAGLNHLEAPVSAIGFRDYRDRARDFSAVAVEAEWNVNLTGFGDPQRLRGTRVSGLFFQTLGVPAALGRALLPEEDAPGRNREVVVSDALWHRLFGGARSAIGQTMILDGVPYDVVGVMPASFRDPFRRDVDVWTPLALPPEVFTPNQYTNEWLSLVARMKPGVTLDQAARDMRAFATQLQRDYADTFPPDWTLEVKSLMEVSTGKIRPALLVLLGAVGFVLLIACANVANLLLARAAARTREVAIRTALGATRWDLVRQLLSESVLLSLVGGALGLALAYWSIRALVAFNPSNLPRVSELGIDGHVVIFTVVVSLATALLFGIAPALQSARGAVHGALKEGGRGGSADRGGLRVRRALVVAEVALALTLLTGAGLLIKSVARLQGVDPGFDPGHLLTFSLSLPTAKYPSDTAQRQFFEAALDRIAQLPGVRAVGATSNLPFSGGWSTGSFNVEGYTPPANGNGPWGDIRVATPDFFRTLRIPLLCGRTFTSQDRPDGAPVVVVDEELARRYFGRGEDPIGKRIWFGDRTPTESTRYLTIVGVVGHAKQEGLDAEPRVQVYAPYAQAGRFGITGLEIAVRTAGAPTAAVPAVRAAIREVDRDQPMSSIRSMDEMIETSMGQRRLSMVLLALFSGLALALASLGIYGVMSYAVTQRSREMGIRLALGATTSDVLRLVVRQGMVLVLIGVGAGVAAALALTRVIASQLYAVRPTDPITFGTVALVLSAIALLATLIPARRATRVDPVVTLRDE